MKANKLTKKKKRLLLCIFCRHPSGVKRKRVMLNNYEEISRDCLPGFTSHLAGGHYRDINEHLLKVGLGGRRCDCSWKGQSKARWIEVQKWRRIEGLGDDMVAQTSKSSLKGCVFEMAGYFYCKTPITPL